MPSGNNVVDANKVTISPLNNVEKQKVKLYFALFFDGTNNQEVQVMIGKRYHRKKALEQLQKDLDRESLTESQIKLLADKGCIAKKQVKTGILGLGGTTEKWMVNIDESQLLNTPRSVWETKSNGRTIMSPSDLDAIYFGYEAPGKGVQTHMEDHIAAKSTADEMIYSNDDKSSMNSLLQSGDDGLNSQKQYIQRTYETFKGTKLDDDKDVDFKVANNNDGGLSHNHPQDSTYTNVALLESVFDKEKSTETEKYIPLYVEGSGTNAVLNEKTIISRGVEDTFVGQGLGKGAQGVLGKLTKMCNEVRRKVEAYNNYDLEVYFYAFGFSRGATTARIFNYVATCEFDDNHKLKEADKDTKGNLKDFIDVDHFLGKFKGNLKLGQVKFLGIYDTVGSIGLNIGIKEHPKNVKKYHMYETDKAEFTFHICAIDEVRQNFALVDIQKSISNSTGLEIFLPGCHTDIGGGVSIGMSEGKNIPYQVYLWKDGIHSEASMDFTVVMANQPYAQQQLMNMGWLDNSNNPSNLKPGEKFYIQDSSYGVFGDSAITLFRRVTPGYSNITLKLMHDFSKCNNLFKAIPLSYRVPASLQSLCSQISSNMGASGRKFLYPTPEDYCNLRRNFISYSASDDTVNGGEVAELKGKKVLARLVYTGEETSKIQHMYDFNSGRVTVRYK